MIPKTNLRILCLHGYTQNATLFHAKTRALHKHIAKTMPSFNVTFHYPNAPHVLIPADIPGFQADDSAVRPLPSPDPNCRGWWRKKERPDDQGGVTYEGLSEGLDVIAQMIKDEGPFDGILGFSQGACAAAMVASILENTRDRRASFAKKDGASFPSSFLKDDDPLSARDKDTPTSLIQGPLKFAICYGGFRAPGRRYAAFYEPKITTPVLHVLGQVDVVVDETRARTLVDACEGGNERVVMHPGGHFVPSQKPWLDAAANFVKMNTAGIVEKTNALEELRAEDMDMPF